eukprot:5492596-Karenia_brevis.AAC.1
MEVKRAKIGQHKPKMSPRGPTTHMEQGTVADRWWTVAEPNQGLGIRKKEELGGTSNENPDHASLH